MSCDLAVVVRREAQAKLLAAGLVDMASMIHGRYGLSEGLAAFAKAAEGGVLKVLVGMD